MVAPNLKYSIGNAASTTPASSIANTDTSLTLTSDTNFAAKSGEGMILIDEGESTEEIAYSTGKTGATLSIPLANRGLEGGSAQAHTTQGTVKGILTAGMWNDLIDTIKEEHNDDGTHSDITANSITLASGATPTEFSTDGTLGGNSDTAIPTEKAVKTYVDANSSGDWKSYTAVTPTSNTLDDPTFELVFAGVDLTTTLYAGMRVKLTQGTVKYFIITKVAFSTNTTVTIYGGTDYDLVSTGTTAVSAFSYSSAKSPAGFPLDPDKWTVEVTDTTLRQQSSPVQNTWYNLTSMSISVPIGIWNVNYSALLKGIATSGAAYINCFSTLSTANNTESNANMTAGGAFYSNTNELKAFKHAIYKSDVISVTSKTTHYLNVRTTIASQSSIEICNDEQKLVIQAVCAYL